MGDFEELDYEELDFEEADDEGLFELGIAPEEMDELDTEQTPDRSAPSLGKEAAVTSDSVPTVTVTTNSLKLYGKLTSKKLSPMFIHGTAKIFPISVR